MLKLNKYKKTYMNIINLSKIIYIDKLVISGGFMYGLSFIGSLKYLDELNILKRINDYYGCSIGSVLSLLLCLNYSIDEIINFSINFNFKIVINNNNYLKNLINNYSIGNSEIFINIIKSFLIKKNIDKNITLLDFYKKTNKKFNCLTFNMSKKNEEIINYITYPNMKVWEAIYCSCALPILFNMYKYNNNYYCDSGIFNNIPINYIKQNDLKKTICISLDINKTDMNINDLINKKSLKNLYNLLLELLIYYINKDKQLNKNLYKNIIWIDLDNINSIVNVNLSKVEKTIILKKGYNITKEQLPKIINYYLINNN